MEPPAPVFAHQQSRRTDDWAAPDWAREARKSSGGSSGLRKGPKESELLAELAAAMEGLSDDDEGEGKSETPSRPGATPRGHAKGSKGSMSKGSVQRLPLEEAGPRRSPSMIAVGFALLFACVALLCLCQPQPVACRCAAPLLKSCLSPAPPLPTPPLTGAAD